MCVGTFENGVVEVLPMAASTGKSSKMLLLINYRLRVVLQDRRALVGTFMAFDKHMNMVLGDCEEWRTIKSKRGQGGKGGGEQKRMLGLVILRGENIVSISVEGPPVRGEPKVARAPQGPGIGMAIGRGQAMPPPGGRGMPMGGGPPPGLGGFGGMPPPGSMGRGMGAPPPGMMGRGRGRGATIPAWAQGR